MIVNLFQRRVIREKRQIDERLMALQAFTQTDEYFELGRDECLRITRQKIAMEHYQAALGERIANFKFCKLKKDHDFRPGGHVFVNGVCKCGQKPTDDPERCKFHFEQDQTNY